MDWLNPANTPFIAKLTAKTSSGGVWLYSWEEYQGQATSATRVQASPGRQGTSTISPARELNNLEVDTGSLVVMWCRGMVSGQMAYEFDAFGADSVVAADTWDGATATEIEDIVERFQFDTTTGLSATNPSTGVVRGKLLAASATQMGAITTSGQVIAGVKEFENLLRMRNGASVQWVRTSKGNVNIGVPSTVLYSETGNDAAFAAEAYNAANTETMGMYLDSSNGRLTIACNLTAISPAFAVGIFPGVYGTTGTGDTVKGGIITTIGSGSATGANTGDQNIFQTIAVSGQSNVVADSTTDTLTLAAGSGITITTNASTDTVTIAASGSGAIDNESGHVSMVGTTTLSSANGTWDDTISVSLSEAGTYELWFDVRGQVEMSAGSDAYISARMDDGTFVVADSETLVVHTNHLDVVQQATGSCRVTYTASGAVTITLQIKRDGATTWTTSAALSDGNGKTRLGYTRIA